MQPQSSLEKDSAIFPENLNGYYWYDMMYGKQTQFLLKAEQNKAKFSDGLGMLVEQAAASFNIWHHQKPDTKSIYRNPISNLLKTFLYNYFYFCRSH